MFAVPRAAHAAIIINEVQVSPIGNRFIELYNTDTSAVDLTGWYIQRKTQGSSDFGSLVSSTNFKSKTIGAGAYFLISHDQLVNSDIVLGSLTLTVSNTIQIKNTAGVVVDKIGWGDVSDCGSSTCAPNPGDGQSIQRTSSGAWIVAAPTPRAVNLNTADQAGDSSSTPTDTNDTTDTSSTTAISQTTSSVVPSISVHITANVPVTSGAGSLFSGQAFGTQGSAISNSNVRYIWNFGDGTTAEGQSVLHTFAYPGTYAVSLTAASGFSNGSSRVMVDAEPAQVSLVLESDSSLAIFNRSKNDLDIGLWSLACGTSAFSIPKDTIVLAGKGVRFSATVTRVVADTSARLFYPNSTVAATAEPSADSPLRGEVVDASTPQKTFSSKTSAAASTVISGTDVSDMNVQTASTLSTSSEQVAAVADASVSGGFSIPLLSSILGLGALLILGISTVWYARTTPAEVVQRERETALSAGEFEIE